MKGGPVAIYLIKGGKSTDYTVIRPAGSAGQVRVGRDHDVAPEREGESPPLRFDAQYHAAHEHGG